jgi:hypothetical protein
MDTAMIDFATRYEAAIAWVVYQCPEPDKFAHMCAGLTIWLLSAALFGRGIRSRAPVAAVLTIELLNECVDRYAHGSWRWPDTLGDIAATCFWPIVIASLLDLFPALTSGRKSTRSGRADAAP